MSNFIEDIIKADLESGKVSGVVTRFPPEPNGYMHIGHAKAICLNFGLAEKFGGKCNLRFDDTNPAKEDVEYVNSIIEDIEWLGFKGDVFYASDYFPFLIECANKLIDKGLAYVDDISAEDMRLTRGTLTEVGKESPNRNRKKSESKRLFADMLSGAVKDGELVLRAKIDMASPNMNMRDPIIYRVRHVTHHRQGDKYKAYPTYDFAHPLEDAVEKVTHSNCSMEFEDHRPLYDWVLKNCDIQDPPHQYEFARLNLTETILSKRYLISLVTEKIVDGWDDPRMPTIAAFRRRGYTSSAIRNFMEAIGVAKANSEVDRRQLESCIRDELNQTAMRVMAVLDPVPVEIVNRDDKWSDTVRMQNNPNDESAGERELKITNKIFIDRDDFAPVPPPKYKRLIPNGTVRLMGAYIIKCVRFDVDGSGAVTKIYAEIVEGTKSGEKSDVKVKGVIHWVNADAADVTVTDYLPLLLEGEGEWTQRVNPNSKIVHKGKVESAAFSKKGALQFVRKGYYIEDSKNAGAFILTVPLKDSYNKAEKK